MMYHWLVVDEIAREAEERDVMIDRMKIENDELRRRLLTALRYIDRAFPGTIDWSVNGDLLKRDSDA